MIHGRFAPCLTLVFISLAVVGCGAILGGQDNGPPPDPNSPEIVRARVVATEEADAALTATVAALGGKVVGRASTDECYEGQNNYKQSDGYDHRCTIRRAVAVAFDGDFRTQIALLDRQLFAAGWRCYRNPCSETLSGLVEEYWDFRKAEYGGADPPITTLPTPTMYERAEQRFDVDYVASDLAGRGSLEHFADRRLGGIFTSYERARPFDVDAALRRASDSDHTIALAIEAVYFEDSDLG